DGIDPRERLFAVRLRDDTSGMQADTLKRCRRFSFLTASWVVALQLSLLAALPRPTGFVNDFASILDEAAEAYLETFLETVERETSAEIVVVTVESLEGMTIEEYANRLFAEWGIGKKQQDNGVLLLIAPTDRTVRIEVGYGLESILPDGLAGEIIRTEIIPEFKSGNFPRGVGRGLNRIAQVVRRDPTALASRAPTSDTGNGFPTAIVMIPFFGSFIVLGGFAAGLGMRTKTYGPLIWGGMFAGIPLLMIAVFSSVLSLAGLAALALGALAMGHTKGRSRYWIDMLRKGTPGSVRDDGPLVWEMGGTSGSSTGGSSDSTGSSSSSDFGGGSSGGGGASGRW
ncbi:MAG: TPM domain-containing protein, partial [Phycisphaerales bacterium]|nr:TPM domain-containing protein [Phycisphaerales bacterium]